MLMPSYDALPVRRWWRIISPLGRRRLGDPSASPMMLWTFQSPAAYRILTTTGVLEGDPELAEPDFGHAYSWMQRQADTRLPTVGLGLLWLWSATTRRNLIDQARHACGDVLLKVRMPREHVLLSEFNDWHAPLNNWLHIAPKQDESDEAWWSRAEKLLDKWDGRLDAAGIDRTRVGRDHWPVLLREEVERSWEDIFNPTTWRPRAHIQAVAHFIHAEQVVAAVRVRKHGPSLRSIPPDRL